MDCPRCGKGVERGWTFCPKCGYRFGGNPFGSMGGDLSGVFERLHKQLNEEMGRMFDKNMEFFDLSPALKGGPGAKKRGFTIRIASGGDGRPKVSVRTFGDVDRDALKEEVEELYGKPPAPRRGLKEKLSMGRGASRQSRPAAPRQPSVTEEPETSVRKTDSGIVVEMKLPGVRSESDVQVNEMEKSIEVKAIVGEKAYFKILTKPSRYSLSGRSFRNGVLSLVFS
jgi:HSP20 family molecular chaperone IbpA